MRKRRTDIRLRPGAEGEKRSGEGRREGESCAADHGGLGIRRRIYYGRAAFTQKRVVRGGMSEEKRKAKRKLKPATLVTQAGRTPFDHFGFVNPPIYRGSTVLFPTVAALEALRQPYTYGTKGTPTTRALEQGWSEIAGAADTVLTPSGLAAIGSGASHRHARGRARAHRGFRLSADEDLLRRSPRALWSRSRLL